MNISDLQHLIQRATFGFTIADIARFSEKNTENVVKILFEESKNFTPIKEKVEENAPQDKMEATSRENRKEIVKENRQAIRGLNAEWLNEMMYTKAQMREKLAFFWHGHFACQPKMYEHATQYINTLKEKGMGKFGDLLLAISKTPAILAYLNNQQNRKNSPNENFARELLELFTLGRGNYTEKDIKESARAFTGWGFLMGDFVFKERQHDTGEKTFFGKKGNWKGEDIIKMILEKKETSEFLVKKIYKFFVNEINPIPNDILAELSKYYFENGYDTEKLLYYIFTQKWFYDQKNKANKVKSPIEFLCNLTRQFDISFENKKSLLAVQKILGQTLLYPPNVAGWAGGKTWIDSSTLLLRLRLGNVLYSMDELDTQAKGEFDAGNKSFDVGNIRKLKANFNWTTIEKYASNPTDAKQKLISFLLPYSPKNIDKYLENASNIRQIAIALVGLPEYQVC